MGYNMNGFSGFGNSPAKKKLTAEQMKAMGMTALGVKDMKEDGDSVDTQAYEDAQNDYDTDNPTKTQIAASKAKIIKHGE